MKKELIHQFISLIAGFLLMIHAFQSFEKRDENVALIFIVIAVLFFLAAGSRKFLKRNYKKADAYVFLVQALALAFSAWQYVTENNKIFAIINLAVALAYLLTSYHLFKRKKHRHHHRSISINFFLAF